MYNRRKNATFSRNKLSLSCFVTPSSIPYVLIKCQVKTKMSPPSDSLSRMMDSFLEKVVVPEKNISVLAIKMKENRIGCRTCAELIFGK